MAKKNYVMLFIKSNLWYLPSDTGYLTPKWKALFYCLLSWIFMVFCAYFIILAGPQIQFVVQLVADLGRYRVRPRREVWGKSRWLIWSCGWRHSSFLPHKNNCRNSSPWPHRVVVDILPMPSQGGVNSWLHIQSRKRQVGLGRGALQVFSKVKVKLVLCSFNSSLPYKLAVTIIQDV